MINFAVFYIEALVMCMIMFGIMLLHNRFNIDRQEKQIKFDRALIAFILYFLADCLWAAMEGGFIQKTRALVVLDTFLLYVCMAGIVYWWLQYVMAVEQAPNRNRRINRFAVLFPFILSTIVLIVNYIVVPGSIIGDDLAVQPLFTVYLLIVPVIYLAATLFYAMRQAKREEDRPEKRKHLFIGLLPLATLLVGMVQELFAKEIPIYCFADSLLMLVFYIQSSEARVSLDPLTDLNNRGQLRRYVSHRVNLYREDRLTVAIMIDVDAFKAINDTYGHSEGDEALVIIADALKSAVSTSSMPTFLCRYGGDEFVIIIHPLRIEETETMIGRIREEIDRKRKEKGKPYDIQISVGYDGLAPENDSIKECLQRADEMLYEEKKNKKR